MTDRVTSAVPAHARRGAPGSPLKRYLFAIWSRAVELNADTIAREVAARRTDGPAEICDLGAGDGAVTEALVRLVDPPRVTVVESDADCAAAAARRGYAVVRDDLNAALSLPSDTFDVVVSNQVIEHLYDTEAFLDEAVRILKPGGRLVISTENPASWHNIGALVIGWQCFSLSNVSRRKSGVGNPLSLAPSPDGWAFPMQHHRLFTPKALAELFSLCGLEDVRVAGAGYHPLSPVLGRFDVTHAHLITASGTKPAA